MDLEVRAYEHARDFERISRFLIDQFRPVDNLPLWLQPRWEYMHFHPLINATDLTKIGVVEAAGRPVGVVHHESSEGWIYLQVHPGYDLIKPLLLDHAEAHFGTIARSTGRKELHIFVNEADESLQRQLQTRGYQRQPEIAEPMAAFPLDRPIPPLSLPAGFRLQRLHQENDLHKMNRVLWRGFDHPGPPPESEIPGRRQMQQAPNFRPELTVVAVAPDGNFVSYCGIWIVSENRITYVEPVATDPDYRRLGLGRAVVLEGIRQTIPLGAEVAWVGSDQTFYQSMGFTVKFTSYAWRKQW